MLACPRCGTENAPSRRSCAACGAPIPGAEVKAKSLTQPLGQTLPLANTPAPPARPAPDTPLRGKQTLLGLAPTSDPPPPPPAATVQAGTKGTRTMIGLPPPTPASEPPPAQPAPAPPTPTLKAGARTMIGLPPAPEPARNSAASEPPATHGSTPPPAAWGPLPSQHKTMLGVARPGIAPLNPGVPKAQPAPLPAAGAPPPGQAAPAALAPGHGFESASSAPPPPLAPYTSEPEPPHTSEPEPPRQGMTLLAIASVALAGVLLVAAVIAVVVFFRGFGPIQAQLSNGKEGQETLELTCEKCPDGTVAALGAASAVFKGARTTLPLAEPLGLGKNALVISLTRPGSRSAREIKLEVPVEFRVRGDLSGLSEQRPKLRVDVAAVADTTIVVDGNVVKLDATGKGRHEIDVTGDVSGASNAPATLERRLTYVVTPPSSQAQKGEIIFRIGIVPLNIEAPGSSIVVDQPTFTLAGRTLRGGTLSVAQRPITVDGNGRFAQAMTVSAVGETSIVVRADAVNHAPRLVSIRVRRVADLAEEAKRFKARATTAYDALGADLGAKRGWAVALDGEVNELRNEAYSSIILLDVRGCKTPPCLVRVVHGARVDFERRDRITVCGHLSGPVEGPRTGSKIPEVIADFVVRASK